MQKLLDQAIVCVGQSYLMIIENAGICKVMDNGEWCVCALYNR